MPPTLRPLLAAGVAFAVVVALAIGVLLAAGGRGADWTRAGTSPARVAVGTAPVPALPAPGAGTEAWARRMSEATDVPRRALLAYAAAEARVRATDPGCRLSWTTLAGIGRVESDHGRHGSATLHPDGSVAPTIIGVSLDGSPGLAAIPDTDGGRLDGDPIYDRAVGPMQFIPTTWARWAADGNRDGARDPHNLDDAALAAARYLCAHRRDTSTGAGWWSGVLAYNSSVSYGKRVYGVAERYARATLS